MFGKILRTLRFERNLLLKGIYFMFLFYYLFIWYLWFMHLWNIVENGLISNFASMPGGNCGRISKMFYFAVRVLRTFLKMSMKMGLTNERFQKMTIKKLLSQVKTYFEPNKVEICQFSFKINVNKATRAVGKHLLTTSNNYLCDFYFSWQNG